MPEGMIATGEGGIGPYQSHARRNQQHDATYSFYVQKALEIRESTLGQDLGSREILGQLMIHWARAFRVAARPSLDLSPLHAANTQHPFYTVRARRQPNSMNPTISRGCVVMGAAGVSSHVRVGLKARSATTRLVISALAQLPDVLA